MTTKKRRIRNLEIDLKTIICETFHEFAKREPEMFELPKEGWEYWATYYRFSRASMIAVDNILKEYRIEPI